MALTVAAGQVILADDLNRIVPVFARKTADETINNSAALQNDDHLFVSLEADAVYAHFTNLTYQSNSTPGFQMDYTLPAGATMAGNTYGVGGSGASFQHGSMTTSIVGVTGTGGNTGLRIWGLIIMSSTAGTGRIRWAQNTANASDTIVRSGSYWELHRVA